MQRRVPSAAVLAAVLAAGAWLGGCAAVGNVKEPKYTVTLRDEPFEVREYAPRVVAETRVTGSWNDAGNEGFRRLAGYIFGKNKGRATLAMTAPVAQRRADAAPVKLAMTAPVGQRPSGDDWIVTFTMPEGETLATLPAPEDPRVVLREVPAARVAVVRFRGRWTPDHMDEHRAALARWLSARGLSPARRDFSEAGTDTGTEVNRYDPPWIPWFLRRNEIWQPLAPKG